MKALGYDRFAAQGGDIGAGVSTALGLGHSEHLIGIHLYYIPRSYRPMMPRGGHFAAAEEPEMLAEDIRAFFRDLLP